MYICWDGCAGSQSQNISNESSFDILILVSYDLTAMLLILSLVLARLALEQRQVYFKTHEFALFREVFRYYRATFL
jgi:hypothetical protein